MTIGDRFRNIGRVVRGEDITREVIKEVKSKEKLTLAGGFLDLNKSLTNDSTVSSAVLLANKGWVYRNNDVIAKEVSTIEFELYSVRNAGQDIVYNPITTHPILDALDKFNDFTDASTGFYITQSHKKLAGNAYWYIDITGININGIYILPPDKIKIIVGNIEDGQKAIVSFEYKDTIQGKQVTKTYTPEEIIHFKIPNPSNSIMGLSTVQAAADDIDMDVMAIEANKQMFKRGLIGNFILSTDKSMTAEQIRQLQEELRGKYGSVENAFKVLVLSGGLEPKSVQLTNKDMEFIAQQEWVRDKIASIFGNNKAVLGITTDVNRANADATIEHWKRTTIRAEMKQITDQLNEFLVPRYGKNLILGFKDPVPEDKDTKITQVAQMINANVITPDEAREILGYDPLNDETSTTLRSSLNVPAVPPVPKSLKYVNIKRFLRRSGIAEKQDRFIQAKRLARPLAEKIVAKRKSATPDKIEIYYRKQLHVVDHAEEIFRGKLIKFINQLIHKAIAEIPHEVKDFKEKQLFDEDQEVVNATLDFTPILGEVAASAGNIAMDLINNDSPYLITNIRARIKDRVEMFARSLIETDRDKMIDMLAEGLQQGRSIPAITRDITEFFDSYSKSQAERITRTEVLYTSNQASLDAWEQSGVVEGKQWLTAPGADAECAQYEGKIVYDLQGSFYSSDSDFADGDPPIHPNCRCTVLPVLSSEKALKPEQLLTIQMKNHIKELESKIDKRTKAFRDLKAKNLELEAYKQELEAYLDD